jgi:hypothetical protein
MLCLSYYCLCFLFNKIRDKGRAGSAWKGVDEGEWVRGRGKEQGEGRRNGSNSVCTCDKMNKFF